MGHGARCEPLAIPGAARAIADLGVTIILAAARLQGETTVSTTSATASTTVRPGEFDQRAQSSTGRKTNTWRHRRPARAGISYAPTSSSTTVWARMRPRWCAAQISPTTVIRVIGEPRMIEAMDPLHVPGPRRLTRTSRGTGRASMASTGTRRRNAGPVALRRQTLETGSVNTEFSFDYLMGCDVRHGPARQRRAGPLALVRGDDRRGRAAPGRRQARRIRCSTRAGSKTCALPQTACCRRRQYWSGDVRRTRGLPARS